MLARRRHDLGGGEAPPMPEGGRRKADVAALAMLTVCMISGNDYVFYPPSTPELVTLLEAMAEEGDPSVELLETLLKHRVLMMQPLAEAVLVSAGVPSELRDLIHWMLAPDAADRPTIEQVAASEVFSVFARAVIASNGSDSSAPGAPRVPVPRRPLLSRAPLPSRGSDRGAISTLLANALRGVGDAAASLPLSNVRTFSLPPGAAALQALLLQASKHLPVGLVPEVERDMHDTFLAALFMRGKQRALVRVTNPELRHAAESADYALRMAAARNSRADAARAGVGGHFLHTATATGRTPGALAAGLGKAHAGAADSALVPRRPVIVGLSRVLDHMPPAMPPSRPSADVAFPFNAQGAGSGQGAGFGQDVAALHPVSSMSPLGVQSNAAIPKSVFSARSPLSALPLQPQLPLAADSAQPLMTACDRRPSHFPHAAIRAATPLEAAAPLQRLVLPPAKSSAAPAPARVVARPPRHRTTLAAPASVGVGPAAAVPLPLASLALRPRI